jgi:hypothetical protein
MIGSVQILMRTMKRAFYHLPERLLLTFGRKYNVEGIRLVIFLQDRDRTDLLQAKVATALRLIHERTPKHYSRVQKFIPNILIFGAHAYAAVYISDLKLCDISRDYALLESTTASHLAMTLVHEATHGYLASCGITYEVARRCQIERICILGEIAFARKLPNPADLLAEAESRLNLGQEYWKDDAFFDRQVEALENSGAPRWLVKWLVTYARKKRAKRTQTQRSSE